MRLLLVLSAIAGMVIAIWLTAQLAGWNEDRVVDWIPDAAVPAAILIVVLLVADTVLPIPATILMLGAGVLLGPVVGSVVNAVGLLLAALAGYWLGRVAPTAARTPTQPMIPLLIAATRGLPVLSESVAIGAGVVGVPRERFVAAASSGAVAVGTAYGVAGWLARDHWSLVLVAMGLAGVAYLIAAPMVVRFAT